MNKSQFILRLTKEQKAKLVKQAKKQGRSMNGYLVHLIEQDSKIVNIPVFKSDSKEYREHLANWPNSEINIRD
jgi:hypothetical protein